jgi:hypothetical protein
MEEPIARNSHPFAFFPGGLQIPNQAGTEESEEYDKETEFVFHSLGRATAIGWL